MKRDPKGYYASLGVDPHANREEIVRAFRFSAQKNHPDKNSSKGSTSRFQILSLSYDLLKNYAKRVIYDPAWKPFHGATVRHIHVSEYSHKNWKAYEFTSFKTADYTYKQAT